MNALLQLILPASLLFAAPAADSTAQERGPKANKMQRHDADGSGTLSAAEVAGTKLETRFAEIDADSDGELTREEMRAHHKAHKGKEGKKGKDRDHRARMAERFAKRDADGNGSLSAAEVAGTKMEKHFSKLDADGDGALTMAEMRAAKKDHKGHKKARDGKKAKRDGKQAKRDGKQAKRDGKQARKATKSGGKKAFAKTGKGRTDRKRFAQRGPKNAA